MTGAVITGIPAYEQILTAVASIWCFEFYVFSRIDGANRCNHCPGRLALRPRAPLGGAPPRTRSRILAPPLPAARPTLLGGCGHPCSETRFGFLARALLRGGGHTRSETWLRLFSRLLDAEPGDVEGGQKEQGQ
jgi:hypothetical protein